jgi:hypothetical protein
MTSSNIDLGVTPKEESKKKKNPTEDDLYELDAEYSMGFLFLGLKLGFLVQSLLPNGVKIGVKKGLRGRDPL